MSGAGRLLLFALREHAKTAQRYEHLDELLADVRLLRRGFEMLVNTLGIDTCDVALQRVDPFPSSMRVQLRSTDAAQAWCFRRIAEKLVEEHAP